MVAEVSDDALVAVRVLAEDVFDDDDDLFDHILGCDLRSNELLQCKYASLCSLLDLDCDDANS